MPDIRLELPRAEHQAEADRFKAEFLRHNEPVINGSALFDQMLFPEWLAHNRANRNPGTVSPDWVAATTFFAVRHSDNKIIGMIDIRHNLEHEFLAAYAGHIGYAVRPSERRRGYATEMLRQALLFAQGLGLKQVMLGCYADNIASQKTILNCGGLLTERKPDVDGRLMHIYWIALS